jgi:NAD(P)-dependent dehydrogenase (short-subunit alcohol dehydrogenase family)
MESAAGCHYDRGSDTRNDVSVNRLQNATALKLDVREEADWNGAMKAVVGRHGALNVLVNNAGITGFNERGAGPQDPEHASLTEWHAVHRTNLDGVFLGCRAAIRTTREAGSTGSIINMNRRCERLPGTAPSRRLTRWRWERPIAITALT